LGAGYDFSDGDYVTLGDEAIFQRTDSLSVSIWFKGNDNAHRRIFDISENTGSNYVTLKTDANGYFLGYLNDNVRTYSVDVTDNAWHHAVLTWNATNLDLYVDGTVRSSIGHVTAPSYSSTEDVMIGKRADTGTENWIGQLDELAFYNRSLTASEVSNIWDDGNGIGYGRKIQTLLNSPEDDYTSITSLVDFNCSASTSTTSLTNISLWHNGTGTWERNQTNDVTGTTNETIFTTTIAENTPTLWTCEACYSDDDCGFASENRTVSVDSTAPVITITAPTNLIDYHKKGNNYSLNWTVSDANLDSCWYDYQGVNTTVTCLDLNVSFNISDYSNNTINFWANDSVNNVGNASSTWTYNLWEDSQTYDPSVTEGSTGNSQH